GISTRLRQSTRRLPLCFVSCIIGGAPLVCVVDQKIMIGNPQAISEFWRAFESHEDALSKVSSADHPVYDLILDRLQQVHPELYFEFSSEPRNCVIIITAEGDSSLFPLVESIVASAPKIAGWSVVPLKPKLGFPVAATWEGFTVAIA